MKSIVKNILGRTSTQTKDEWNKLQNRCIELNLNRSKYFELIKKMLKITHKDMTWVAMYVLVTQP